MAARLDKVEQFLAECDGDETTHPSYGDYWCEAYLTRNKHPVLTYRETAQIMTCASRTRAQSSSSVLLPCIACPLITLPVALFLSRSMRFILDSAPYQCLLVYACLAIRASADRRSSPRRLGSVTVM
jgi:hypothetical protein